MSQILIALSGTVHIHCENADQSFNQTITLNNSTQWLIIPPHIWHSMTFEPNSILLSLASTEYQESDYIRNYDVFIKYYSQST